jgi:hypothetical protein
MSNELSGEKRESCWLRAFRQIGKNSDMSLNILINLEMKKGVKNLGPKCPFVPRPVF